MNASDGFAARVYKQARAGTPYNPGVSAVLAELITAQARHESANFTSNLFKKYNNAVGYSYYRGSPYQTGAGSNADNGAPIAAYGRLEDSIKELVDWLYRRSREGKLPPLKSLTTPSAYAEALKASGYYGDTLQNYLKGLANWFRVITPGAAASSGVILLLVAAVLYFSRKM